MLSDESDAYSNSSREEAGCDHNLDHFGRQLLDCVISNCLLDGKKVIPIYKRPFDLMVKRPSDTNWLRRHSALLV